MSRILTRSSLEPLYQRLYQSLDQKVLLSKPIEMDFPIAIEINSPILEYNEENSPWFKLSHNNINLNTK